MGAKSSHSIDSAWSFAASRTRRNAPSVSESPISGIVSVLVPAIVRHVLQDIGAGHHADDGAIALDQDGW